MKITRKQLVDVAEAAGCKVSRGPHRHYVERSEDRAVCVWADGAITRANIDLTVCRSMSLQDAVKLLQL